MSSLRWWEWAIFGSLTALIVTGIVAEQIWIRRQDREARDTRCKFNEIVEAEDWP